MKTIQKRWLPLFLLATVTFLFPACEGNSPSINGGGGEDTSGIITVKIRNRDHGDSQVDIKGYKLCIDEANNFYGTESGYHYVSDGVKFCDMGTKKLSAIKTVPTSGWASPVAVIPNHSYIIRCERYDWSNEKYFASYYKLYVVDYITATSGGIIGAEVQYCEWTPEQ